MRKSNLALFACALALASSPSWAWTQKEGSITNIDPQTHQLTLDGTPYAVERQVDLSDLRIGDRVAVNAEPRRGGAALVNKIRKIG